MYCTNRGKSGQHVSSCCSKKKSEEANVLLSLNEKRKEDDDSHCVDHVGTFIDDGG